MTREEALETLIDNAENGYVDIEEVKLVFSELEQKPCEDAISRAEAIRVASGYCHPANIAKELARLPSVNVTDINVGKCKTESEDKE